MTSVNDISMFDSNFGHQPASSQPHLDNFEDYSFAFDPAHTATSCSHRALQEVLNRGNPMTTMTNISKGHTEQTQASQTTTASSSDTEIERLKRCAPSGFSRVSTNQTRDVMELKRESEARVEKIEKLYEMFLSLVNTVAKQGVAM
jgi:hypothetical protein